MVKKVYEIKNIIISAVFYVLLFLVFGTGMAFAVSDSVNVSQQVTEEGNGGGSGGVFNATPPVVSGVIISEITFNSATISWKTDKVSAASLSYGETDLYEIGTVEDHPASLLFSHEVVLNNLESGTKYYFKIKAKDSNRNEAIASGYSFMTLPELKAPANVNFFTAKSFEGKIVLSWKNPTDDNFAGIQINRRANFPVLDINDGKIIYSGTEESFIDVKIKDKIKYFYTAFSYDDLSNFSSGAIVSAVGIKSSEPQPPIPPEPAEPIEPAKPSEPPIVSPPNVENLEAVPDPEDKKIIIRWDNPADENFEKVEIYRSRDFPPLIYGEGELIYKGRENSFEDKNTEENIIYYYTAFTKDKDDNYSAGKTVTGTFKEMPVSPIGGISIEDISFIASDKALLLPKNKNSEIYIFAGNEISVYCDAKNLPKTLKTILITIGGHSYILNSDKKKEFYKTKFNAPKIAGNYPAVISVLDFKHGEIYQTKAELMVESYGKIYEFKDKDYESKNFLGKKILDIGYWILDIFNRKEFLDLEKTGIKNAKITLYEFDEENSKWRMWDAEKYNQENPVLTDENGKYGFMVPNGKYKIVIEKDEYDSYSKVIEVENNIIKGEMEIKKKVSWLWIVIIVILFLSLIVGLSFLRRRESR